MVNIKESLEALVLRCQIDETSAFEELFKRFQPRLRYFVKRLDQSGIDTEDLLQDIWLIVIRKITELRDPAAFPIWLYKIARNRVYRKSQQKLQLFHMSEKELHIPTKEDESDFKTTMVEKIHKALIKIQPHHREVLTLHFLERMSYEAIAKVIGCNLGTVKSRLYYAKQSLRRELEHENE